LEQFSKNESTKLTQIDLQNLAIPTKPNGYFNWFLFCKTVRNGQLQNSERTEPRFRKHTFGVLNSKYFQEGRETWNIIVGSPQAIEWKPASSSILSIFSTRARIYGRTGLSHE
jgi:hypothetical protein